MEGGEGRRRAVARRSRSTGGRNVMVALVAVLGYALLCGVLYLR